MNLGRYWSGRTECILWGWRGWHSSRGWGSPGRWVDWCSLLGLMHFVLKGRKVFFFLFVTEATPEKVTLGKLKLGRSLKEVQCFGHPLL